MFQRSYRDFSLSGEEYCFEFIKTTCVLRSVGPRMKQMIAKAVMTAFRTHNDNITKIAQLGDLGEVDVGYRVVQSYIG